MATQRFRDLVVWQRAMALVKSVYDLSAKFPKSEEFGFRSQIQRAAVSVPSNIAEGSGRGTKRDFVSFLRIARGSLREVETQIEIASMLGYIDEIERSSVADSIESIAVLLSRLTNSMQEG